MKCPLLRNVGLLYIGIDVYTTKFYEQQYLDTIPFSLINATQFLPSENNRPIK